MKNHKMNAFARVFAKEYMAKHTLDSYLYDLVIQWIYDCSTYNFFSNFVATRHIGRLAFCWNLRLTKCQPERKILNAIYCIFLLSLSLLGSWRFLSLSLSHCLSFWLTIGQSPSIALLPIKWTSNRARNTVCIGQMDCSFSHSTSVCLLCDKQASEQVSQQKKVETTYG